MITPGERRAGFAPSLGYDAAALEAAAHGATLCTLVNVDGAFSRSVGAQMAVQGGKVIAGDMTGDCLEEALVSEANAALADGAPRLVRYGRGSPFMDIRLPCGGGIDCFIDAVPDKGAIATAIAYLGRRQSILLSFYPHSLQPAYAVEEYAGAMESGFTGRDRRFARIYRPQPRLLLFGTGTEMTILAQLARVYGCCTELFSPAGRQVPDSCSIYLGSVPAQLSVDPWTAIIFLFHDHEWEIPLLKWALFTQAFYIGALGGVKTAEERKRGLKAAHIEDDLIKRIRGPVGLLPRSKDARTLGLSILAEVVESYQRTNENQV